MTSVRQKKGSNARKEKISIKRIEKVENPGAKIFDFWIVEEK